MVNFNKFNNPQLENLHNWLKDLKKTTEHIKEQNDNGIFFENDIETLLNSIDQADLQCKRIDDDFELILLCGDKI